MRHPALRALMSLLLGVTAASAVSAQIRVVIQNESDEWRPKYHFAPRLHWMNDPNGLVFYQGEYHLFYQHNPLGLTSEHKSWGHAVSTDLVRWQHLPVALKEENGAEMYSGSVVVDSNNTSGLCQNSNADKSCLVAIYTAHTPDNESQQLAFSNDKGRTWIKFANNPVLDIGNQNFRDPKVFWHAASNQWVMVVAVPKEKKVRLYGSGNLKAWKMLSEFGPAGVTEGVWECPDLFELPIEGSRNNKRWVLIVSTNSGGAAGGSGVQYFIGTFDGVEFTNDNAPATKLYLDYGKDLYAAVTWSDIPPSDGRRILMGWMTNLQYASRQPTAPWRGMLSLPRVLTLRKTGEGLRVQQQPIAELQTLREKHVSYGSRQVVEGQPLLAAEGVAGWRSRTHRRACARSLGTRAGLDAAGGTGSYCRTHCTQQRSLNRSFCHPATLAANDSCLFCPCGVGIRYGCPLHPLSRRAACAGSGFAGADAGRWSAHHRTHCYRQR